MVTIAPESGYVTVVNVFTVAPGLADRLIALAVDTTQRTICHAPGFVSSSFHKGLNGGQVVNYAQWASRAQLQASMQHPAVQQMLRAMSALATAAPGLYEVAAVIEKP